MQKHIGSQSEKQWNFSFRTIILCILLILLLVSLSYSIVAWSQISQRTETQYSCEELSYTSQELCKNTLPAKICIADDFIKRIEIPVLVSGLYEGEIFVQITNEANPSYNEVMLTIESVSNGMLVLDVSDINLIKGETYNIIFEGNLSSPITLKVADNQFVECIQYFAFADAPLYKIFLIFINLTLLIILFFSIYSKLQVHIFFLIIALSIGMLLVVVTPPLSVPDEYRHFVRAYQLSKQDIIADRYSEKDAYWIGQNPAPECDFPKELADIKLIDTFSSKTYAGESVHKPFIEKWKDLFHTTWSGDTVLTMYIGTSNISPLAYIPQVIGILIAQWTSVPVMIFYSARIASLIISSLIITFAIKKTPFYKYLFFAIGLLPDVIFARSSCSTDGLLIALLLLLLAYTLDIKNRNTGYISKKEWCAIFVLSVMIGSIKVPYLLYFLVLGIIDFKIIKLKKMPAWFINTIMAMIVVGFGLLVYVTTQNILGKYVPEGYPSENISYLMQHPVSVLNLVAQTLISNHEVYLLDAFGSFGLLYFAYYFIIVQVDSNPTITIKDRFVFFVLVVGFLVGLTFSGYFMNSPLITYIWGLQSRYYIPVLPILFMLGSGKTNKPDELKQTHFHALTKSVVSGCALISVLTTFMQYYL